MNETTPLAFVHDLLARQPFSIELERFLLTEHHFVEGSLVVSLNAPFGSGKTTFIQMWAADLAGRRTANPKTPRPVIINAWETDYCGDPLVALLSALSRALADPDDPHPEPTKAEFIREAVKDMLWFTAGLANTFVSSATGLDAVAAGEVATDKKAARAEINKNAFDALNAFEQKSAALAKLKHALAAAFQGEQPSAIVLIDELDRCRPDYAISYLETIKHIFDVHGIIFVLAVDESQLRSAAGVLFGEALVFPEYYRKFSHRTIQLPVPDSVASQKLVKAYCSRYLNIEAKRSCILEHQQHVEESIAEVFYALRLRPRQIQEAFRILGHATAMPLEKKMQLRSWTFGMSILFMSTLRVSNFGIYQELSAGVLTIEALNQLLTKFNLKRDSHEWWFKVLVSGMHRDDQWKESVVKEMVRSGWLTLSDNEKPDIGRITGEFNQAWGSSSRHEESGLARVHRHIENLQSFGG